MVAHGSSGSAHAHQWQGPTSRGNRLARKLGKHLTLDRLDELLKEKRDACGEYDGREDEEDDEDTTT